MAFGIRRNGRQATQDASLNGGLPDDTLMRKGGNRITQSKVAFALGSNVLTQRASERTSKTDGDEAKIQQDWRNYDLPPRNLAALSRTNLTATEQRMQARHDRSGHAAQISGGVIAHQALAQFEALQDALSRAQERLPQLEDAAQMQALLQTHWSGVAQKMNTELQQLRASLGMTSAEAQGRVAQMQQTLQTLEQKLQGISPKSLEFFLIQEQRDKQVESLARLQADADRLTAATTLAERADAHLKEATDSLSAIREELPAASKAIRDLGRQLESSRTSYDKARSTTIRDSLQQFFEAYSDIREQEADRGRSTAMQRVLGELAAKLDLPARILDGRTALERAELLTQRIEGQHLARLGQVSEILEAVVLGQGAQSSQTAESVAAFGEAVRIHAKVLKADNAPHRAEIADALLGQPVRQLTAGRTSQLPDMPSPAEATAWQKDADTLRALAQDYGKLIDSLKKQMTPIEQRADAAARRAMSELVQHLPQLDRIQSAELRNATTQVLQTVADQLLATSVGTLRKDAPLVPMQLMHIVGIANTVTDGDPQRNLELFTALAEGSIRDTMRAHIRPGERPLTRLQRDLAQAYQVAAHQVPEAVTSLLAASPQHAGSGKVDWRDVQSFWRCDREIDRLGDSPREQAHQQRLDHAMRGLSAEVADGRRPEPGTPERRWAAMVKSAVWRLETFEAVNASIEQLAQAGLQISPTEVGIVHGMFEQKGRGNPADAARRTLDATRTQIADAARTLFDREQASPEQRATAAVVMALEKQISAHRGSEGLLSKARRHLTGGTASYNSGAQPWTQPMGWREKDRILQAASAELERAHLSPALLRSLGPAVQAMLDGDNQHPLEHMLALAAEGLRSVVGGRDLTLPDAARLDELSDRLSLARGTQTGNLADARKFLHDAIDRTELGDRMDMVIGRTDKLSVPIRTQPLPHALNVTVTPSMQAASGAIVNVQANNDCVQLTLGSTREVAGNLAVAASSGFDVGHPFGHEWQTTDAATGQFRTHHSNKLKMAGPGLGGKGEYKHRHDPATVLKCSIEPENGLRDLADARGRLKQAIDLSLTWRSLTDSAGRGFESPLEALCDKMDLPPTIDQEARTYTSVGGEAALNVGAQLEIGDRLKLGLGVVGRFGMQRDVMRAENQQGAEEKYVTHKKSLRVEGMANIVAPRTTDKAAGVPLSFGPSGAVAFNMGGEEVKFKFPVGTDRYRAYKLEYGLFGRDMKAAQDLVFSTLPQVAKRVEDVCKGLKLDPELTALVEAEVIMNFARRLREHKTDRFSTKAESSMQWAHRGLDAGIASARASGDAAMTEQLTLLRDAVTAKDRDQAVKYFVAAGEYAVKRTTMAGHRFEAKSMKEDPIPDTRSATLRPTEQRLKDERAKEQALADWQQRVVATSLASVRATSAGIAGETTTRRTPSPDRSGA
ncbi:coiled-coil domain-containing protein [Hydrogenophaga soli]